MARRHKYAAEHGAMVRRLLGVYAYAAPKAKLEGREWYPAAERIAAELAAAADVSTDTAAGVLAALSPQTRWRANVANAEAMLAGRPLPAPTYRSNERKASEIAAGGNPADVLGGPKVRAFFANLIGIREIVTVDVWAQRAAYGRDLPAPKASRYRRIAAAYRAAADLVGEHPRDFQAIVWLSVRPMIEHGRDNATIGDRQWYTQTAHRPSRT